VLVTTGAHSPILSNLLGQWRAIDSLVEVAKLGCLGLPNLAVTGGLTAERMGNFVQQNLLNNVQVTCFYQVPRDSDSFF
jgi:3-keto-L-gulonate-6-phosphate decarboxylase